VRAKLIISLTEHKSLPLNDEPQTNTH